MAKPRGAATGFTFLFLVSFSFSPCLFSFSSSSLRTCFSFSLAILAVNLHGACFLSPLVLASGLKKKKGRAVKYTDMTQEIDIRLTDTNHSPGEAIHHVA